jgi:hypothetical protein
MTYQMRAHKAPLIFELAIALNINLYQKFAWKIERDLVVLQNLGKQIMAPCNWSCNDIYYFLVSNK